jgi:hypothetical protein
LDHLIRAFRVADRVGFQGNLGNLVFAVAVALAEAVQMTLAWQLIGYAQAHYPHSLMRGYSHHWLQARLANLENTVDMTERANAITAGARLDRRGFMRLLVEAENSAEVPLVSQAPRLIPARAFVETLTDDDADDSGHSK